MAIQEITLMEAYLIESIRQSGETDDDILAKVKVKHIADWESINENFDFTLLLTLANRNEEAFQEVIQSGYRIKFLTLNGLRNLLKLKFNKVPEIDFTLLERGVSNLQMSAEELRLLRQLVSINWNITVSEVDGITVELV